MKNFLKIIADVSENFAKLSMIIFLFIIARIYKLLYFLFVSVFKASKNIIPYIIIFSVIAYFVLSFIGGV